MTALCRDCAALADTGLAGGRRTQYASPRLAAHAELASLALAHIACGVVLACCYSRG
jgi:hypothetical protein